MRVLRNRKYVIWLHDASDTIGVDIREEYYKMEQQNDLMELSSSNSYKRANRWAKKESIERGYEDAPF